jgi:hypothetical protein
MKNGVVKKLDYLTKNGIEIGVEVPAKYAVCSVCEGRGTHVNPAIDGHGLTAEDFEQDPDFEEAYFEGRYDVSCEECNGLRVVPEVDEPSLTKRQRFIYQRWLKQKEDQAKWDAEDRLTRFYEDGGRW